MFNNFENISSKTIATKKKVQFKYFVSQNLKLSKPYSNTYTKCIYVSIISQALDL